MIYKYGLKKLTIRVMPLDSQLFIQLCEISDQDLIPLAEVQMNVQLRSANFISHSNQLPYSGIKILLAHVDRELKSMNLVIQVDVIE